MRVIQIILIIGLCLPSLVDCGGIKVSETSLVLTGVTLRDPELDTGPSGVTLVVDDGRITRILDAGDPPPEGGTRIDATGLYVIPGLWDLHTHLWQTGDAYPRLMVAHGVTGARDLGGQIAELEALKARIESGKLLGPRIVMTGPTLNGAPNGAHHRVVSTPAEAATAVSELKSAGVDLLKTHNATEREVYLALLDAARENELELVGHVPKGVEPLEACRAGQASIEHIATIFEGTYIAGFDSELEAFQAMPGWLDAQANELVTCFAEEGTLFVPTLRAYDIRARWAEWVDDPDPLLELLGADVREQWLVGSAPTDTDRNPQVIELRRSLVTVGQELVRRLHEAGAPIGAGTDFPGTGVIPGKDLHRELRLLAAAGLSPREALRTSTRGPGPGAGGEPDQGRLVEGAPADLVLLRADPFKSLDALDEIDAVVLRGRWIGRTGLDAVLKVSPDGN